MFNFLSPVVVVQPPILGLMGAELNNKYFDHNFKDKFS